MRKIKIDSGECPCFNECEPITNKCSNENNPTYWRGLMGICEYEFCPIKAGDQKLQEVDG